MPSVVHRPALPRSLQPAGYGSFIPIRPHPPAMGTKTSGSSSTNAACCSVVSFRFP
jgi:hypothetical protein